MSWVPDSSAGRAAQGRRLPAGQRPVWMVVLTSLMVVVAFNQFLGGMSVLADGPARLVGDPVERPGASTAEQAAARAMHKGLSIAVQRIDPLLTRGYALAKILMGGLMLFAVAAIATNDRRGRRGTLLAAWAAIPYHVAGALFFLLVRERLLDAGPDWVREVKALAESAALPHGASEQMPGLVSQLILVGPVGMAVVGIAFSAILIAFFGGRRGRAFYGLPPRGAPEASGGG
jgi:hypothetical protein